MTNEEFEKKVSKIIYDLFEEFKKQKESDAASALNRNDIEWAKKKALMAAFSDSLCDFLSYKYDYFKDYK